MNIQASDAHSYKIILQKLRDKNIDMRSFLNNSKRSFKVVIRNLHFSTDVSDVKSEIESYGYRVFCITNMTHRVIKSTLNLFVIELERKFLNFLDANVTGTQTPIVIMRLSRYLKCAGEHYSKDCSKTITAKDEQD